jgi:hypothetical protein
MIILITILLSGCTKHNQFTTYKDVTVYCYNKNTTIECGLEQCIMLNSAEFNDNIKFSAEKNYLQCKLDKCGRIQ